MVAPRYFHHLPDWTRIFTESGIVLSVCSALILNILFNGLGDADEAEVSAARAAALSDG
jgi:xanthine/uracil permease